MTTANETGKCLFPTPSTRAQTCRCWIWSRRSRRSAHGGQAGGALTAAASGSARRVTLAAPIPPVQGFRCAFWTTCVARKRWGAAGAHGCPVPHRRSALRAVKQFWDLRHPPLEVRGRIQVEMAVIPEPAAKTSEQAGTVDHQLLTMLTSWSAGPADAGGPAASDRPRAKTCHRAIWPHRMKARALLPGREAKLFGDRLGPAAP